MIGPDEHLDHLRREGAQFLAAYRSADPDTPIAACPGWSITDLLEHVGRVHRWVRLRLRDQTEGLRRSGDLPGLGDHDPVAWYLESFEGLVADLAAHDPDRIGDTWAGPRPGRFWHRRMAQETAVHRWDAQRAVGSPAPIDRALAVDGIGEVIEVMLPVRVTASDVGSSGESIHLHATDGEGEWSLVFGPEGLVATTEHAKGDVAARGRASDLLLLLWGRATPADVEVFGDGDLLDRFLTVASF